MATGLTPSKVTFFTANLSTQRPWEVLACIFYHFQVQQKERLSLSRIPEIGSHGTILLPLNQPCGPGAEPALLKSWGQEQGRGQSPRENQGYRMLGRQTTMSAPSPAPVLCIADSGTTGLSLRLADLHWSQTLLSPWAWMCCHSHKPF